MRSLARGLYPPKTTDDEWSSSSICIWNSTEERITHVHAAGPDDIDDAVKAARLAFHGPWSELSGTERGALMWKLADIAEKHTEAMATIDTWNNG